jgi:hypothetical protein
MDQTFIQYTYAYLLPIHLEYARLYMLNTPLQMIDEIIEKFEL